MLFGTLGPFFVVVDSELNSLVDSQDEHLTVNLKAVNILLDPSTLTEMILSENQHIKVSWYLLPVYISGPDIYGKTLNGLVLM